ncbi:MAG: hypothetical protein KJ722_03985, partial [Candidatus Omnitrophica bacterium]|nr:hypothetical protein [Candidatus Omnitrophota bacterium]
MVDKALDALSKLSRWLSSLANSTTARLFTDELEIFTIYIELFSAVCVGTKGNSVFIGEEVLDIG